MEDITCAFSGKQPKEQEYIESPDELGEMPVGWTRVTLQTRKENPEWGMMQAVKMAMAQQLEDQIVGDSLGDNELNIAKISIKLQVEAQFAALEDRIPQYLVDERTTYISNPSGNDEMSEMYDKLLESLDLKEDDD